MWIIGCDFHPSYQQVAALNVETGEVVEQSLKHEGKPVTEFYASLPRGALVGMEATCAAQWFERLLEQCGHELWVGDPATIRASQVRQQKTDTRDARHLLQLLETKRFPRIWVPQPAERDLRQLLLYRHKLVQWHTSVSNQLHAMACSQGVLVRRGACLTQRARQRFQSMELGPWAAARRQDLLRRLDEGKTKIAELDKHVQQQAQQRPAAVELMKQKGIGPIISLAFTLTLGPTQRFRGSKQVVSYLGLNPREHSSGGTQRLGRISKQGNRMMRWLLIEAAHVAAQHDPELRRVHQRLAFRRGRKIAAVAVARKLAVKLYWRLRELERKTQTAPPAPMQGSSGTGVVNAVSSSPS